MITFKDLLEHKFWVTPEQSEFLQEYVFKNGGEWTWGEKEVDVRDTPYLYLSACGKLELGGGALDFKKDDIEDGADLLVKLMEQEGFEISKLKSITSNVPAQRKPFEQWTDAERKQCPIFDGCIKYFPNALAAVAQHSLGGQMQHAPDEPLQWHREKSTDELGSISRHLLDFALAEQRGDVAEMEIATQAIAWRALAHAERFFSAYNEDDPERYKKHK